MLKNNKENDIKGYASFQKSMKMDIFLNLSTEFKDLTLDMYKDVFEQTCQIIDNSIVENHGVRCFTDGNPSNTTNKNCYFLHVCDIMNIMLSKHKNTVPGVLVQSNLLQNLPSHDVVNDLEYNLLSQKLLMFLVIHTDYFYTCYGYYGNHSFIPIRLNVDRNNEVLTTSSFFMNDKHFVTHQFGKLKELNQNETNVISRVMYRSI